MLFTETQLLTLRAVLDRIIPADDFPSATGAGVDDYLLKQLSPNGGLAVLVGTYRMGLDAIEVIAQQEFAGAFAKLTPEDQDACLRTVEGYRDEVSGFLRTITEQALDERRAAA